MRPQSYRFETEIQIREHTVSNEEFIWFLFNRCRSCNRAMADILTTENMRVQGWSFFSTLLKANEILEEGNA